MQTSYAKLRAELITISPAQSTAKELEGHAKNTRMSVNDLVAYLVGWGQLVLKWNRLKEKGEPFDLPETGYKWNELGRLAQKFYSDHRDHDLTALLRLLDATVADLITLVESKTNAQLYKQLWYEQWPFGRLIQFNTSSPYANARARLRKWKKEKGLK